MLSQEISVQTSQIQIWPIDKLVFYARNPRKNDAVVDRMCASIREFGFKTPVLARSDGEVVDGHLRLKAARKLGITEVPVILCDEWNEAQVKAFRLMVNRSVTWADWDEELLAIELQELSASDFDLSVTGFDPREIDGLLAIPEEEEANAVPPVPDNPVSRLGDLWLCGKHRVLCGDATNAEAVARLLGDRKPKLMVTDPPYGIELDSEWRDRAGLNGCGPAEASYMKQRTKGHTETTILRGHSSRLVRSVRAGPKPPDRLCLARIEVYSRGAERSIAHRLRAPSTDHMGQGPHGAHENVVLVSARALLVREKEECSLVRQSRREFHHLGVTVAQVHHGWFRRGEVRPPHAETGRSDASPDPESHQAG